MHGQQNIKFDTDSVYTFCSLAIFFPLLKMRHLFQNTSFRVWNIFIFLEFLCVFPTWYAG